MKNYPFTFADITGDAADFPVHHFLVELFDVERLNSERQSPCQHGKRAHTSAHTHMRAHIYQENTFKCLNTCKEKKIEYEKYDGSVINSQKTVCKNGKNLP